MIFAGGVVIPFLAPSMVANAGLTEAQLPLIYFIGGICTFATTPMLGRLSDRYDKLKVLGWVSVAASITVLLLTNLSPGPVSLALLVTALFMITMSGRFAPAMAMITNSVDARYRGGFMSVNAAIQQASGGFGNVVAGWMVATTPSGRLTGYPSVGLLSVGFFWITFLLAVRLRAAAPHASRPRASGPLVPATAD